MYSSSDGSRPATPAAIGDEAEGRASVASRRFTPAPPTALEESPVDAIEEAQPQQEQTTLLHDEEESFALAPVDASALKGGSKIFLNNISSLFRLIVIPDNDSRVFKCCLIPSLN